MIKTLKLKISGMHCTSCAMDIDGTLEDTDGVVEANTNYAKQEMEVKFDEGKVSKEKIDSVISSLGYSTS